MDRLTARVMDLARLALAFGRVSRRTYHEDGERQESDTDHTVMLGLIACAYAKEKAPHLDLGLIAQFTLVHDLTEAYAGDTMTFKIMDKESAHEKEVRERAALERIKKEFGDELPWIHETIEAYESLESPEARFVKTMDKCMPGLTHYLNDGMVGRQLGLTREQVEEIRAHQRDSYANSYAKDQPEALGLWDAIVAAEVDKSTRT